MNKIILLTISLFSIQLFGKNYYTSLTNYSLTQSIDSIEYFLKASKNKKDVKQNRIQYLEKAFIFSSEIKSDSQKAKYFSSIAYQFYQLGDTIKFLQINSKAEKIAYKVRDTFLIADIHWSYADYYNKKQAFNKSYTHYNQAYKYFSNLNKLYESARMLFAMSYLKGRYRDYMGSEILVIKAIEIFKELKNYKRLHISYNHLAQLQMDIKEYDKAIFYYNKALLYFNKIDYKEKNDQYIAIYNNIGNVYLEKRDFTKALQYYKEELNNKKLKISQYARVIDNRAYCKLLMCDTTNIKHDFYKALYIRDSLHNKAGIVSSKIRLSDYYKYIKDTLTSFKFAKEANILAKEIKNGGDYLTTLQQLANLDTKNSKQYLDRYIEFNDSLISEERRMQNKFTRIEFETDEYIEETERLSQQRIWIIVTSIGGVLILSLLYFLRVQKVKNEKLSIEAEHQKANEEVYILTLQQQAKLEEERIKERNRISEELHDGILGKLFGTRFGLGFLPLKGDDTTLEKHQELLNELQDIEKEIRDVSHKLSDNFNSSNINFTSIIKQLLEDKGLIGKFTHSIHFSPEISWKELNEITKANIYRIIQEALQNIIKHAKATHVSLDFSLKNTDQLIIKIQDNGVGFDVKKGKKGIGIKNIKSRIEKLKGSLNIESEINIGTTLHINTPYIKKDGN
ncbi:tetratricopeptide repeat-containing sensor histidine kinase [Tenacibaculum sp. TC6]|uniref:tetratricopeptide repeat-containing sensor histidine kinase n=1 Tax=Tenacibaculum sp. TC6 TaxID=3423223 RepID=UPI003D35D300